MSVKISLIFYRGFYQHIVTLLCSVRIKSRTWRVLGNSEIFQRVLLFELFKLYLSYDISSRAP